MLVKGVSKRVIVVRSPDIRYFEQAIFFVKDDAMNQKGISAQRVLEEACRVADGYIRQNSKKLIHRIPAPAFFAMGAALTAVIWLISALVL